MKHFEERYIIKGKRNKLDWKLDPIPTIHSREALKRPSVLTTPNIPRKQPKERALQPDQLQDFQESDQIIDFENIDYQKSTWFFF